MEQLPRLCLSVVAMMWGPAVSAFAAPGEGWSYVWQGGEVRIGPGGCTGASCQEFCKSTQAWTACLPGGYAERRRIAALIFAEDDDYRECLLKRLGPEMYDKLRMARWLRLEQASEATVECGRRCKPGEGRCASPRQLQMAAALRSFDRRKKHCVLERLGREEFDLVLDAKVKDTDRPLAAMKSCGGWVPRVDKGEDSSGSKFENPWESAPPGCRDIASCEAVCTDPDNFDKCLAWPHLPPQHRARILELKRQTDGAE